MTQIPVFPHARVYAWPKSQRAKNWPYQSIADALQTRHATDAHFAAYSFPASPYRLSTDAFVALPGGVPMVLAVFDIDAPGHGAHGGVDEWWLGELPKLSALLAVHPGAFVYRTRGGYRIVYALTDTIIRDRADLAAWKLRYCTWVAYLRRAFGVAADYSCKDATRLSRLPFVVRDGRAESRETIGDPGTLGSWSCSSSSEDELEASRHAKLRPPKAKPKDDRPAPVLVTGEGVLYHAFAARGAVGRDIGGKHAIRCPWASSHSGGTDFDSSTVLFAPNAGETLGYPHCSHAHCSARTLGDWISIFSPEELAAARVAAGLPAEAPEVPAPPAASAARDVPTLVLSTDEHRVNDEAIAALARVPDIYQRGGSLAELVDVDGRRVIRALPQPRVRELLASAARFVEHRVDEESGEIVEIAAHVPEWCTRAVASRGAWSSISYLRGVVDAPALRPDGSVIQTPGYDAETGYLYVPACSYPPIAEAPTQREAMHAARVLLDVVRDFPFEAETHRAAWLAAVLTLFARPAFAGPSPLIGVDANVRAAGKGKLADTTAIIGTGRAASKTPQPKDDDEMRKRITAVLREGERLEVIDNVSRPIEDGSFDALLTSEVWKDRKLGVQETIALPNLTTWVVTGNNLEFGADTARRTLHVRLRSPLENPEDREDFAHGDLLAHVRAQRPELVRAALTILRSYFVGGRPSVGVRPWGSFEAWSRLVASAVVFAGLPDPQETRVELEASADTRKVSLVALVAGWAHLTRDCPEGVTAKSAVETLYPLERLRGQVTYDDGHNALREAIEALVPTPMGKAPSPTKLAYQLRHFRGRIVGGRYFGGTEDRNHAMRWRVLSARHERDERDSSETPTCEKDDSMSRVGTGGLGLKHGSHGSHPPQLGDWPEVAQ